MEDFKPIYSNPVGMALRWEKQRKDKVQLVFRDMGFLMQYEELELFASYIKSSILRVKQGKCHCCGNHNCKSILLVTPFEGVDLAVSRRELFHLEDLIQGALFQTEMEHYIMNEGRN